MEFNNLEKYLNEFEKIQDMQISAFSNLENVNIEKIPELDTIIFERKRAFENLRNAVSIIEPSYLSRFSKDVERIITKDKIFMEKLDFIKKELSKKINQSIKGKHLLKTYSGNKERSIRFMNERL